jgi:hypothetical protein
MGNFTSGVADGLESVFRQRAESSAHWRAVDAESAADAAKREARRANGLYEEVADQVTQQTRLAEEYRAKMCTQATGFAACRLVIAAMIEVMDKMPPAERELFRDKLVQITRKKVFSFDNDPDYKGQGWLSAEAALSRIPENKVLGLI